MVRSIALYGAPIWAGDLMASPRGLRLVRRFSRVMSIRVARGYRTISGDAAGLLAGAPPFELLAEAYASVYRQRCAARQERGKPPSAREVNAWKRQSLQNARE